MYSRTPYAGDSFLENEVLSASPGRLVQLMYEGAIQSIGAAIEAIDAGDVATRSRKISKAVAIVNELATSLDLQTTGPWARDLVELYDYMARRLHEANFQQRPEPLAEVRNLLSTLLDAWKSADTGSLALATDPSLTASSGQPASSGERISHIA